MNSKPIHWTAAQKAAAFDTTADQRMTRLNHKDMLDLSQSLQIALGVMSDTQFAEYRRIKRRARPPRQQAA